MSHYLTTQGLSDLQEELKKILETDLPAVLSSLNTAREDGDLKENAAYQTAMKVKDELTTRQQEIEEILQDYEIIAEDSKISANSKVVIGSLVKISYESTKKVVEYKIVGSSESNILEGKISNESPLAEAIIGKKVGETATFKAPNGKQEVKILEIK